MSDVHILPAVSDLKNPVFLIVHLLSRYVSARLCVVMCSCLQIGTYRIRAALEILERREMSLSVPTFDLFLKNKVPSSYMTAHRMAGKCHQPTL